ncbi:hypothetical protein FMM05_17480 [Flavobacterium zepuense]|uniref:Uncharacterized protein n=1 Tax=Flavobacterium zepuense TaxID=2593302 RepID=A0A552UVR8_9FLAO|nr:hypothetical protein [Flavobacterium zepuense]TRW22297.1 hypothetical protein FMM05_17480 [Flavobacterium zepuense]
MKVVYIFLSTVIMTAALSAGMAGLLCLTSAVTQHKHPETITKKEYAVTQVTMPKDNRQLEIASKRP